jgi:hypothetical protein
MIPYAVAIEVEYHKDVVLRYWLGTSNPAAWGLRFRLVDEDGTVLVEKTLAEAEITTASGTKSDGTAGYYAQVDLTDGTSYALTPADNRHHILERTDSGSRKVHCHGPYSVTLLPGQSL